MKKDYSKATIYKLVNNLWQQIGNDIDGGNAINNQNIKLCLVTVIIWNRIS